jgi:hypothetical protein
MSDQHFGDTCPFLLCKREGPHTHSVCPVCGAVRYGNAFCEECKRVRMTTNLVAVEDGREASNNHNQVNRAVVGED